VEKLLKVFLLKSASEPLVSVSVFLIGILIWLLLKVQAWNYTYT